MQNIAVSIISNNWTGLGVEFLQLLMNYAVLKQLSQ